MNEELIIQTAREFAAIAARRFPDVDAGTWREKFAMAIITAVANETIMYDLHDEADDLT